MFFSIIFFTTINNAVFATSIQVEGNNIEYELQGGTINDVMLDFDFSSLVIDLDAPNDGEIKISIPRSLLDAKIGETDDIFFILIDGEEVDYEETSNSTDRTLSIQFSRASSVIEIIGTDIKTTQDTVVETTQDTVVETTQDTVVETKTEQPQNTSKGGGCLIATATFGSELASEVQQLRELRDNSLFQTQSGTIFMNSFNEFYYLFSPTIADWERENLIFKEAIKLIITPLISTLSLLNYVDLGSEESVLGYGISLILLNIGMYFAAPMIILKLGKKFHK